MFNATGPAHPLTMAEMLEGINAVTLGATPASPTLPASFLEAQELGRGWSDLPVWIAPEGDYAGFTQRSIARALAVGLTFRPLSDTVTETMAFYAQQSEERKAQLRAGLPADCEARVIAAWKARKTALL